MGALLGQTCWNLFIPIQKLGQHPPKYRISEAEDSGWGIDMDKMIHCILRFEIDWVCKKEFFPQTFVKCSS